MRTKPLITLAAVLAALAAGAFAPAALADCPAPTVSYVGNDWGPTPVWRVSVPGATWDVAADTADAALSLVGPLVSCPDAPPAPTPDPVVVSAPPDPVPAVDASQIVAQADVTYVGDSWGPVPIWRVSVPSRGATYDVAAADAESARAAVLAAVQADVAANPNPQVAPASQAAAPALAASADGAPVQVDASPAAPVQTPAKSKTAKKGVHQAPATSKTRPQ